jgi:hypothetical protein
MHRRVFNKKTWLSPFSYAQSRISFVFCCFLGFLVPWFSPLQLNKIWQILCIMYGEEGGWTLFLCLQKLYLTDMFEWLLCYIHFDNIQIKVIFLFGPCFRMQTTPRKPSSCLDFKNQGKKSAKTRKLSFLRNDCAWGRGESRKPTKNQGEIQGSRKEKTKCFGWISAPKKRIVHIISGSDPVQPGQKAAVSVPEDRRQLRSIAYRFRHFCRFCR